jgi:two-component system cell cycle sensor histidine kinase/response regulator CckA
MVEQALVIDDEKHILNILRTLLIKQGFKVKVAHDGREGIKLFDNGHDFDLVITDIRMPQVNGNQVAKHIRGSDKPNTPIVAMSGYPKEIDKRLFDFSITKPFRLETIIDVIEKIKR